MFALCEENYLLFRPIVRYGYRGTYFKGKT